MRNITNLPAWERLLKRIVWKQIGDLKDKYILDFGSGEGANADHFAKENKVVAIEPWEEMLKYAWKDNEYRQIVGDVKALSEFPEHVGIVDGVNEEKQLFHCVFGPDCDAIIRYSDTNLRPLLYDTVIARFIRRLDKNDKVRTLVIDIRIDNSLTNKFIKTVDGHIRTNINTKGERFGFVGDYYIPANIIGDLVDGDEIEVKVVYDGRRWKAVERIYN